MPSTLEKAVSVHEDRSKEAVRISDSVLKTPEELAQIVSGFASSEGWMDRVRLRTEDRWYERAYHGPDQDIWIISWMPGQSTGFHDHGESAGAFIVATGVLEEHRPGERPTSISAGQSRSFPTGYAHDVRNTSVAPAVSIHAYSPPLTEMNEYDVKERELVPRNSRSERVERLWQEKTTGGQSGTSNIDRRLSAARSLLRRLSPNEAHQAVSDADGILVDIRPEAQRKAEGEIPGALIIERNVLEWRLDPTSSARLPIAGDHDLLVIVFCSEGYTSSLAAVALQDLGLWRATDMVGGFQAWRASGLPTLSSSRS